MNATQNVEKRCVVKDDLFKLVFTTEAKLSPDGKKAIYNLLKVEPGGGPQENTGKGFDETSTLWLLDLETGETRQLTRGGARDWGVDWAPDGRQVAFLSTRSGLPQIYLQAIDGGEALPLTHMRQGAGGSPIWSPDGQTIAFSSLPDRQPVDPNQPYRVTRSIYRFNGIGYLDEQVQDIFVVDVKSGETHQLTHDRCMNTAPLWSPDGQEILYRYGFDPDSYLFSEGLRAVDLQGKLREIIPMNWGTLSRAIWKPDGSAIVFSGTPADQPPGTKIDLWVIDRLGGTAQCRTKGITAGLSSFLQSDMPSDVLSSQLCVAPDGRTAWAGVQQGGENHVYRIALEGEETWEKIISGERNVILLDAKGDCLLAAVSLPNDPINLYRFDLDGSGEKQLTHFNDTMLAQLHLPEIEHFHYPGGNQEPIEAWLMKPTTGQNPPYPTVLYIHGGPHGGFGYTYSFDFQLLAGAGYAVLYANPHGSMGYGSSFATSIIGDMGGLDYNDLMAGVDDAVRQGWSDAERLGVAGISYGGFMSCRIIGLTDRFKAAVPENPVTNWVSLCSASDIGPDYGTLMLGGKPFEIPETYRRCSPLTYAHRCKTPTLLVQGESDYRCPPQEAEQFYAVLKSSGCTVEMLRLPNSAHDSTITGAPHLRMAQNEALLDWMDRYLKADPGDS